MLVSLRWVDSEASSKTEPNVHDWLQGSGVDSGVDGWAILRYVAS